MCLTEHHFTGYNTYGNPFTFGAYLAPQLQNAHVVLSVAVPALWNPMNFAEAVNTLDLLTRGRCVIGVGTGGSPQEYKGLGRDPAQRGALMEEVIDIALAAMAKEDDDPELPYSTPHSAGVLTRRIMPGSFTRPHPRFARASLSDEGIVGTASAWLGADDRPRGGARRRRGRSRSTTRRWTRPGTTRPRWPSAASGRWCRR